MYVCFMRDRRTDIDARPLSSDTKLIVKPTVTKENRFRGRRRVNKKYNFT